MERGHPRRSSQFSVLSSQQKHRDCRQRIEAREPRTNACLRSLTPFQRRLHPAVFPAVREIHHHPDNQPDYQSRPVDPAEFVHHVAVKKDAHHRHKRHPGCAEGTRLARVRVAQGHDGNANNHEGQQRSDVRHFPISSIGVRLPTIAASMPTSMVFFHGVRKRG